MNVFDWAVPFVAEKVTELLHALVHAGAEEQPGRDLSPYIRDQIVGRRKSSSDIVKLIQGRMDAAHASNRLKTTMKSLARVFGLLRSVRRDREENLNDLVPSSSRNSIAESEAQEQYSKAAEIDFLAEKRRPSRP